MIAPIEIRTGLRQVVADHIGVRSEEAIVEVARMLGFQRTGQELQRVIEQELRHMLDSSALVLRDAGKLYVS